ncbi:apolipoprotein L3 isoform X2 [Anolis carolinensis]|uniref:apolipoprotein L3 isoform X2 n=1 Tax=Anolis carolinensis TaxID=28377 RepID=UPI0004624A4E|nr:PREDICTED: apolipoprotein L3 isoform X2 [Anolis carolinensis]|eukprot:XP_008108842.1 PREDICTED: apolipoprotein L3 isoform X2 [Anolis carolinensis]
MTSKEYQIYEEDLRYDDTSENSEELLDEINAEQWRSLMDKDGDYYMEMTENESDLEREESGIWDEMDSNYLACFLKEFPVQKQEIEKSIQCLREMADGIDKTHKDCTIASIAANSTSASSGILSILGLTLAPITAGGSLILTATGIGLGALATVTGLSTTAYESVNNSKERKRAEELMAKCHKTLQNVMHPHGTDFSSECLLNNGAVGENIKHLVSNVASQVPKMYRAAKEIRTNVKALKIARANPALKALAKRAAAAGSTSKRTIRGLKHVQKTFAGTSLAMSKGARMLGTASAGVFLLFDAYSIAQDAKHLTEGAKAETASEIREKAKELEEDLYNLNTFYEELKRIVE